MKSVIMEMKVDTVGSMSKTGAKCVLKGEKEICGLSAKFSLTVTCEDVGLFDELNIGEEDLVVGMILKDPSQQNLDTYDVVEKSFDE